MNTQSSQTFSENSNSDNDLDANEEDEEELPPTKGFWIVMILVSFMVLSNLFLTATILHKVRMGKGMEAIEIVPEEDIIKFWGDVDLDKIMYRGEFGRIEGFLDDPVHIDGDAGSVIMKVMRGGHTFSRIIADDSGISVKEVTSFEVKDAKSGEAIFSVHKPDYKFPKGIDNLSTEKVTLKKISSAIDKNLNFKSNAGIRVNGAEGITAESHTMFFHSISDDIKMNSTHGSVSFEGGNGIYLNMENMPIVRTEYGIRTSHMQYKLCVCVPKGQVFRIPIPRNHNSAKISCLSFDPKDDPCA